MSAADVSVSADATHSLAAVSLFGSLAITSAAVANRSFPALQKPTAVYLLFSRDAALLHAANIASLSFSPQAAYLSLSISASFLTA
eukprot:CAMPEP_0206260474 /NCGR_PEP_ID=MMETSP0047_2-20121206/27115_1 /ASSEMBLY_ACC=CAM_ASM_000192 /TAXON_ID=195065 /ORGANISM="Chroomonas mesostigmatica_cf, Strain CCMP1168" /LENGTH=85 /DNA_ID=CAMNT_0053687573 /DNA_START=199 /DNA_END=456 /DNA_ORIENTATION=+